MANTVITIKSSGNIGSSPTSLQPGELAINYADGKLYYGDQSTNAVLFDVITDPAGLNGEIQFNDNGSFGSSQNLSFNSSTETLSSNNIYGTTIETGSYIQFSDGTRQYSSSNSASSYANSAFIKANSAFNSSNSKVDISGDTMTGYLTLHANPSSAYHAATKTYVDSTVESLYTVTSAKASTTENLDGTYSNSSLTLTATSNVELPTIDGVTLEVGQNILVKDQNNAWENGSYNVTDLGSTGSSPWVLTRCGYCDTEEKIPGSFEFVVSGDTYKDTGWVSTVPDTFAFNATDGTGDITYVQFSGYGTNIIVNEQMFVLDEYTGDNVTSTFTLTTEPEEEHFVFVTINGVDQHVSSFNISGNQLVLSEAPDSNDEIEVRTFTSHSATVSLRDYKSYVYQPNTTTTTVTGADHIGNILTYDTGKVEVFLNGSRLVNSYDYTANTGNSIVLQSSIDSGDTLEVVSLSKAYILDWDSIKPNNTNLTDTTSDQVIDSFKATDYRTAKYIISMSHDTEGYHSEEILLLHDNSNVYITSYAQIWTANSLGTLDASLSNNNVTLSVTPVNNNTSIKLQRITVTV